MHVTRRSAILSLGAAVATSPLICGSPRKARSAGAAAPRGQRGDSAAFLRAVESGDVGEVRRWLARQPELAMARDASGRSAYVLAHLAGRDAVVALLRPHIELDVIEAVLAEDWSRMDELVAADPASCKRNHPIGGTPLYAAALTGSLSMWRLRGAGCDSDAAPVGGSGFTPARGAMEGRTVSGAWIGATDLLSNGADCNARQQGGDSVLHGAVRRRSELLVRLVIRKGASVVARDAKGRTAQDLAAELEWTEGVQLLAAHKDLPRDHRASRFLFDANRQPIKRPDLSDVPQKRQSEVTGNSHMRLERVRKMVEPDPRLTFSMSGDDELAIEASAHIGNRPIIRFHLDHGAPLSLPTAVSLGDRAMIEFLLERDPLLIHERGAHDFPVMWYAVLGRGGIEMAELLQGHGVPIDQESHGNTALHWCVKRNERDLAAWLIESGADIEAHGYKWDRSGQTPLQLARAEERADMVRLLVDAGARDG